MRRSPLSSWEGAWSWLQGVGLRPGPDRLTRFLLFSAFSSICEGWRFPPSGLGISGLLSFFTIPAEVLRYNQAVPGTLLRPSLRSPVSISKVRPKGPLGICWRVDLSTKDLLKAINWTQIMCDVWSGAAIKPSSPKSPDDWWGVSSCKLCCIVGVP